MIWRILPANPKKIRGPSAPTPKEAVMAQDRELNLALFIDYDNVALGARDAGMKLDIGLLLRHVLVKGKVIVKRAYADWHYYKKDMEALHEAAIELIEVPMPRISGKNSADIKMVVDAIDMCYSKEHIDAFVLVTGDSDFSPLVSKLRENAKRVIGVGVKNSTSRLLIGNCDEFVFYDEIHRQGQDQSGSVSDLPEDKRKVFDFLVLTAKSLLEGGRDHLYSSLIKDTMTRTRPDFSQRAYGYSSFGDLLEEAGELGLLKVERDAKSGGTWVVHGLGPKAGARRKMDQKAAQQAAEEAAKPPPRETAKKTKKKTTKKTAKKTTKKTAKKTTTSKKSGRRTLGDSNKKTTRRGGGR
jgi:uncharacterized protein (TIGR00288 family)